MAIEERIIDGKKYKVEVTKKEDNTEDVRIIEEIKPVSPKGEVTQEAIDRIWKQFKESEEKSESKIRELVDQLKMSEESKVDLVDRIKALEESRVSTERTSQELGVKVYGLQKDGTWVFPQTEKEWDNLIAERPTFGTDLRAKYNEVVGGKTQEIRKAQKESAIKVATSILPDMYKKDSEGKPLLDKNGHPVPDENSDVFNIYCQVAAEEGVDDKGHPVIFTTKNGPELIALKVQAVMGTERETELRKRAEEEKNRTEGLRGKKVIDGQVAPPGHPAPTPTKVEVKFSTDYEKQRAEQAVAQGKFKDLEEYCRVRDNKAIPYSRGGV